MNIGCQSVTAHSREREDVNQHSNTPTLQQHIKMSVYRGQVASPHSVTLVTLGDAAVGKTSLINRFCSDTFNEVSVLE